MKSFHRNEIINNSTNTTEFDIICTYRCKETNVGIRDELKVIPDGQMTASSNNGTDFLPEFGRLQGTKAWCPDTDPVDGNPYLQIDLGLKYDICGVEAQGLPGASLTTSFTLSYSNDGSTFTGYNSNQVT